MSCIYTGATLKSNNLHLEVNRFIHQYTQEKFQNENDEEDITLKSIKRW